MIASVFSPGIVAGGNAVQVSTSLVDAADRRPTGQSTTAAGSNPGAHADPAWPIPLSALNVTRDRPVFAPSRRPRAVELASVPRQPAKIAPPKRPVLALVGVIVSDQGGIAILVDPATKGVVRLRTGEGHSGWTLRRVTRQGVTLQSGTETAVLALPTPSAR